MFFANGSYYYGEWKNSKPNKDGILVYPDGEIYDGSFKDGKADGEGNFKSRIAVLLLVFKINNSWILSDLILKMLWLSWFKAFTLILMAGNTMDIGRMTRWKVKARYFIWLTRRRMLKAKYSQKKKKELYMTGNSKMDWNMDKVNLRSKVSLSMRVILRETKCTEKGLSPCRIVKHMKDSLKTIKWMDLESSNGERHGSIKVTNKILLLLSLFFEDWLKYNSKLFDSFFFKGNYLNY